MASRMGDPRFRAEQDLGIRLPHVKPINDLVDELSDPLGRGWMPYVAPVHGGIGGSILSILRDPGPMTNPSNGGSGFLCVENDDDTARRMASLLTGAGIPLSATTPWNAYPWYINRKLTAAEVDAGLAPLLQLLPLLNDVKVVMLHGGDAHRQWRKLVKRHLDEIPQVEVIETYHTSKQAFIGSARERQQRLEHLQESMARAASIIRGS